MWLINVDTSVLHEFFGDDIPEYAILSHIWDQEEVTFQDIQNLDEKVKARRGFKKIEGVCQQAKRDQLKWAWVDTCCIDKKSSAELSEAINSMFNWYANSNVCYALLSDVRDVEGISKSRWFSRGWTLQELLAPSQVAFYSNKWEFLGFKEDANLRRILLKASAIPYAHQFVLVSFQPRDWSIAERMSWASRRQTTRVEDRAYCLLGIFGVNMPLLYGEGEQAFTRLQEEIMRISDDRSLFAWTDQDMISESPCGFLARSPANFVHSHAINACYHRRPEDTNPDLVHTMTSRGIRIQLALRPTEPEDPITFYALLGATGSRRGPAIMVRHVIGSEFVRVHADTLLTTQEMGRIYSLSPNWFTMITKTVIMKQPMPNLRSLNATQEGNTTLFVEYSQLKRVNIRLVEISPPEARLTDTCIRYPDWKGHSVSLRFEWEVMFTLQIYHDGSFVISSDTLAVASPFRSSKTKETEGTCKVKLPGYRKMNMEITARSSLEHSTAGGNIHCIVLHGRPTEPLWNGPNDKLIGSFIGIMGIWANLRFLYELCVLRRGFRALRTLPWASSPFILLAYWKTQWRKPKYGRAVNKKDYKKDWRYINS